MPTTSRIVPSASPALTRLASAGATRRESCATSTPNRPKRRRRVSACWRASTVVGAISAACLPEKIAAASARSATSVLPKPTSPQTSRSIGRPEARSAISASTAAAWSGVGAKPKPAANRSISLAGGARTGASVSRRARAASSIRRAVRAMVASASRRRRGHVPPSSLSRVTASGSDP